MTQPFQIYDSTGGGRSFGRRPIVLARLPHVGAAAKPAAFTPLTAQSTAFSQGTRFYVDAQHGSPPAGEAAPAQQFDQEPQSTSHRRHHGPHRRPITGEKSALRGSQSPLATGLSEIHGRLTSYSGLIVTLALAASAALLYWMIIVPSQRSIDDFDNAYDAYGATKVELPQFHFSSSPPAKFQVPSPVTSSDSLPASRSEQSKDDEPAAVVAQQASAWSDNLRSEADSPLTNETSAPPAKPAPDLIPLPEESNEPEPIYDDASARAYPTTAHPLAWDLTRLGRAEGAPDFFPVPQTAEQTVPAAIFR